MAAERCGAVGDAHTAVVVEFAAAAVDGAYCTLELDQRDVPKELKEVPSDCRGAAAAALPDHYVCLVLAGAAVASMVQRPPCHSPAQLAHL